MDIRKQGQGLDVLTWYYRAGIETVAERGGKGREWIRDEKSD